MRKNLGIYFLILFFLSASMCIAQSAEPVKVTQGIANYQVLSRIPILHDGRIKPLDTYARNLLIQFSGKDTYAKKSAIAWLAAVLFTPESTRGDEIFLINNPDIATALGIDPVHNRRYSFNQIEKAYTKLFELTQAARNIPEKERSLVEIEILRVFENVRQYADLSQEFLFAVGHDDFNGDSFLDTALRSEDIRTVTEQAMSKNQSQWSPQEAQAMGLLMHLFQWSRTYKDLSLGLIPGASGDLAWVSPWDAIAKDFKNDNTRRLMVHLRDMVIAYQKGVQIQFDMAGKQYFETMLERVSKRESRKFNTFGVELIYHGLRPFLLAKIFYILSLIFFVISFMSRRRIWYSLGLGAVIAAFIPHLAGLAARTIIMARPPVTNLYETFIFVALITVVLGIIIERVNKQWLGIVTAGVSGTVLLFIASKYSAEGDTLKMLVAVLNSNFWLSTHVTTITMGYGATCVAGVLGHIWLLQAISKKPQFILDNTYMVMMGILGLALTLTFLGTNLGGIWADQSWGRFWGWDPKENGALMIVLWSAMLFHAKISRMIGALGMAIGNVIGMIVVMWAWFGVNLLSIGLHSYGFTSGIANTLLIYLICEIIFCVVSILLIKYRRQ